MMKFLKDEKGQGLSEYALIIALVAVVAIAGLVLLGPIIADKFNQVSCDLGREDRKIIGNWVFVADVNGNAPSDFGTVTAQGSTWDGAKCYKKA